MSIKARLSKAKKTIAFLIVLRDLSLKEGKIEYAINIEERIKVNESKVKSLTEELKGLEIKRRQKSWFNFLAR